MLYIIHISSNYTQDLCIVCKLYLNFKNGKKIKIKTETNEILFKVK